jgi:hypothetical protein
MIRLLFGSVLFLISAISTASGDQDQTMPETGKVTTPTSSVTTSNNLCERRTAGGSDRREKCKRLWQFPHGYICETKMLSYRRSRLRAGAAP